jgi:hypothetical protein
MCRGMVSFLVDLRGWMRFTDKLVDFECANCIKNGASERMTINVLLITSGTTIASLLYFAHNFGLW